MILDCISYAKIVLFIDMTKGFGVLLSFPSLCSVSGNAAGGGTQTELLWQRYAKLVWKEPMVSALRSMSCGTQKEGDQLTALNQHKN